MYLQLSLLCSLACAWLWFKGLVQGRGLLETHSGIMSHPSFQSSSFYHTYYAGGSISGMILVFYPRPNSATQSSWGLSFFKHFSLQVLVLTITVQSRHSYTHFFFRGEHWVLQGLRNWPKVPHHLFLQEPLGNLLTMVWEAHRCSLSQERISREELSSSLCSIQAAGGAQRGRK